MQFQKPVPVPGTGFLFVPCPLLSLGSGRRSVACRYFLFACGPPPAKPHPQHAECSESADRVEQRIVSRGRTAGDERLVKFIQDGISCGAEECREAPRPAPPFAVPAHTAVEQQAKDKIFREVRALSDEIVNRRELIFRKRRN